MVRNILNIFEFFKSAFVINFVISVGAILLGGIDLFVIVFLSFGFILSIVIKEVNYKNHYVIYSGDTTNLEVCKKLLILGHSVALVFKEIPETYLDLISSLLLEPFVFTLSFKCIFLSLHSIA